MNIGQIIRLAIFLAIFVLWFFIAKYLRLPHLKVFIHALPPHGLYLRVWGFVKGGLIHIVGYIIAAFFVLYIIWKAVKKFMPNFPIPLKTIILKIPPFPQLEKAGIFRLFDGIIGALFQNTKIQKRALKVGKVLGVFVAQNTALMLQWAGLGFLLRPDKTFQRLKGDLTSDPDTPSRQQVLQRNAKKKPPKPFESSEARRADDDYRQCLEENVVPMYPEMSRNEKRAVEARNTISRTVCKARYVNSYANMLTGKI